MNHPFLKRVAADIKDKFGKDLSEVAIVFNNKRPVTYLKKHLAEIYGHAIWSPQFFTIQEFFSLSSDAEQASQLTQFFYLFELHNQLLAEEGLPTETLEEFYPIAEIILSDFSQLDYELVDIDTIYLEIYDTSLIDIEFQHLTTEQQQFIHQFWQSFTMGSHTAVQERFLKLWKRLPKLYRLFKAKLTAHQQSNYPTIYRNLAEGQVDHPDFTAPFKKILFVGFNALNAVETKMFQKWQAEEKALFYFDADDYYLNDPLQEAGLFIRRNIIQSGLRNALPENDNQIGTRTNDVHLYAATGKVSQPKLLHDLLINSVQAGKSTAILLADESLLVPLLQSLPDMKVNITTGYPLMQSALYGIIDLWLEVQQEITHYKKTKLPYDRIETFLNNSLTNVDNEEKKQLQDFIARKQLFEVRLEDITIRTSVLPDFFTPLKDSQALIPQMINMIDQLLKAMGQETQIKQIDSNLLIETRKTLNQLQLGFSKIPHLSVLFQIGLIRKAIAPINSAIEGDPLDGVQIMGLLESRCLNFDNIYILGANEGILPKTSSSPTFLPNNLRRAYNLPILENQDALSAYLFYRHFQYSTNIHILYNSLIDESSSGEETRFIRQLEFESKFKFIKHQQHQNIQFPAPTEEIIIPKTGAVAEKLYNTFIKGGKKLSATALTTYLQSPLQFFFKHVAEIKEPPSLSQEFEMNKLGTIIHNVMEIALKRYKGKQEFTPTQDLARLFPSIDQWVVQEIAQQYESNFTQVSELNSLQRILHKIACEYVKMYLQYDIDHYTAFRIIELENDRDYHIKFPIMIAGKEEYIRLYGIIDRVDEVITPFGEVKKRIVDYKTGGDTVDFKNIEKAFAPNTSNKALIQTLFYTYIFEQVSGHCLLEPHLYVARKMREEGTLFYGSYGALMTGEYLATQKEAFLEFLTHTLEELFDPNIPFRHNPEAQPYPSDPYTLFYQNAIKDLEEE